MLEIPDTLSAERLAPDCAALHPGYKLRSVVVARMERSEIREHSINEEAVKK
jgi:hypothetical protein